MRKIILLFLVVIFTVYSISYIELSNSVPTISHISSEPQVKEYAATYNQVGKPVSVYSKEEKKLLAFIQKHLLRKNGEVVTNTLNGGSGGTLSESVGLIMEYSVLRDRKDLFDREFGYLKSKLLYDGRFVKWQSGGGDITCNALIDDLRIIKSLLNAYDKWTERAFFDMAGYIQDGIYEKQVENGKICEFYDWKYDMKRKILPLCYPDLYTLDKVHGFNKGWMAVQEGCLNIINNGRIKDNSPFFQKYYDYGTDSYKLDEEYKKTGEICLTYTICTVLNLAEINMDTGFFTEWLKNEMKDGKLYAWYNPYSLKTKSGIESTAVYGLAAIYARKMGEDRLYHKLVKRMLQFMVNDKKSTYYGGFGNVQTKEFYSFDNLTALLALAYAP